MAYKQWLAGWTNKVLAQGRVAYGGDGTNLYPFYANSVGSMKQTFGGDVYSNTNAATADAARRFETSEKKLRDSWIYVATKDQLFGDASNQYFTAASGGVIQIRDIDISTLYFKNLNAGSNGVVSIVGVME